MQFEADIIKALQTMSNPFMDLLNKGLSFLGTETFFLIVAVIIYWCLDKTFAHRFLNVYILGVAVTSVMKLGFARTRPFNEYAQVKSIGAPEQTYSFPSGHTESISAMSTMMTIKYGKKYPITPLICSILIVLVMLSRMFLGQHYLSDVFCGLCLGVLCSIVFNWLLSFMKDREEWFFIASSAMTLVVLVVLGALGSLNPTQEMLANPIEMAKTSDLLKGLGAFFAFNIGYFFEKKYIKYDVKANRKWWAYALRLAIGLGVTVAIQQLFKLFLPESMPMLYCFFRYFLMAGWVAIGAPALFKKLKI